MPESASNFVDTNGIRTHYLEAGSGPTLVLMHGGGAGADAYGNWRECIPIFAKKYRVIAPDMVGFGRSDKPSPDSYTYDQPSRNRQLVTLLDALNIEKTWSAIPWVARLVSVRRCSDRSASNDWF